MLTKENFSRLCYVAGSAILSGSLIAVSVGMLRIGENIQHLSHSVRNQPFEQQRALRVAALCDSQAIADKQQLAAGVLPADDDDRVWCGNWPVPKATQGDKN